MAELDEEIAQAEPIGAKLKSAREGQGLTLDDIAARTRVPIRHLQHIEREEWDELPAATYSVGFARAYANAVGLNGSEIGAELRSQLGATPRIAAPQYEPADPARVPPTALAVIAAVIAILLAAGYLIWRSNAVGEAPVEPQAPPVEIAAPGLPATRPAGPPPPSASAATGPVVLTASDEVWLRIYDGEGGPTLFEALMKPGDRYVVPETAQHPMIRTGRPNALRVTVGSRGMAPLGAPEQTISNVSLLPGDLLARTASAAAAGVSTGQRLPNSRPPPQGQPLPDSRPSPAGQQPQTAPPPVGTR